MQIPDSKQITKIQDDANRTRPVPPVAPIMTRNRIPVAEVWFDKPLPRLTQGAAYIGSGEGWKHFKVLADIDERTMIVTLPDRRTLRVPMENIVCYVLAA